MLTIAVTTKKFRCIPGSLKYVEHGTKQGKHIPDFCFDHPLYAC